MTTTPSSVATLSLLFQGAVSRRATACQPIDSKRGMSSGGREDGRTRAKKHYVMPAPPPQSAHVPASTQPKSSQPRRQVQSHGVLHCIGHQRRPAVTTSLVCPVDTAFGSNSPWIDLRSVRYQHHQASD